MATLSELVIKIGADMTGFQQGISDVTTSLDKIGGTMTKGGSVIAASFGAAGGLIAAGLAQAVGKAAEFEQSISKVKAVMSPADVDKYGASLSQLAIKMGSETAFSANEAAQGIEELVKAGVSAEAIMSGGLEGALNLATAGELELADAAEIASTALNAFSADGLTVTQAADLLAGAANASATSVSELKFGLSASASVAAGVGMTFEDTATTLALFAQNGLKGSDAGTSLKTMLMNLQPHTDKAFDAFNDLGLITMNTTAGLKVLADNGIKPVDTSAQGVEGSLRKLAASLSGSELGSAKANKAFLELALKSGTLSSAFYDTNGSLKSMDEIAGLLQGSMSGLTDAQRAQALQTLFGSDAIRAGNILYKEGADGIRNMNTAMKETTAADVAKEKLNNFKGAVEQLKGAFETAQITIGTAFLPVLQSVTGVLQKAVDWFNNLSPSVQKNIAVVAAIVAGLLLLIAVIGGIIMGIGLLSTGLAILAPLFVAIGAVIWPVIAIIAALIAIGYLVIKNWDVIKATAIAVWNAIWTYIEPIVTEMIAFFTQKFEQLSAWWGEVWPKMQQILEKVWNTIVSVIQTNIDIIVAIWEVVWPHIEAILRAVWEHIKVVIDSAISIITGIIDFWIAVFTGDWQGAWDAIVQILSAIWDIIKSTIEMSLTVIKEVFGAAWDVIKLGVETAWNAISEFFTNLWNTITEAISTAWNAIIQFYADTWQAIFDAIEIAWNAIKEWFAQFWADYTAALEVVWNAIKDFFQTTWNSIKEIATTVWNAIKAFFDDTWAKIKSAVETVWNAIKQFFDETWAKIKSALETAWNAIKAFLEDTWNKIKEIANTIWTALKDAITKIVDALKQWLSQAWDEIKSVASSAWNAFKDVILNVWDGIKQGIETVVNWIKEKIDSVLGWVNDAKNAINSVKVPNIFGNDGAISDLFGGGGGKRGDPNEKTVSQPRGTGPRQFATGAVVNRPTLAWVGEGRETEAVMPLSKLQGLLDMKARGGGDTFYGDVHVTIPVKDLEEVRTVNEFFDRITQARRAMGEM